MRAKPSLPTVDLVAGARPNFMKIAPLWRALSASDWCQPRIVHTGQHYDPAMSTAFFDDLELPAPDHHLGAGSGHHGEQTARVLQAYERLCLETPPDWTVVVGDVNSTFACALAAKKLLVPVAHLEAGLRSGDETMPEEINRLLTDRIADLLWTPSIDADVNLRREGVPEDRIVPVGNVMIDTLVAILPKIETNDACERFGVTAGNYAVATLHRPANVDDGTTLALLVEQLCRLANRLQVVLPLHPRTRARLDSFGLADRLEQDGLRLTGPLGYLDFMRLLTCSALVVTDSGGVQEETTWLGIPCVTVRPSTERPITVTAGTNRLSGPQEMLAHAERALREPRRVKSAPALWDGHAAERAAESLRSRIAHTV